MDDKEQYSIWVDQYAKDYGVDPYLLKALITCESAWNPDAESPAGAVGLCQLMKGTAIDMGLKVDDDIDERFDSLKNLKAGAKYLAWIFNHKWIAEILERMRVQLTLAAYNAGIGNVRKYEGIPPFTETRVYIDRVMELAKDLKADEEERKDL